jgi:Ethanolamine utilization protein EutJ (predicted chaperonin)
MKVVRLFTGDDQQSHFEEIDMDLFDAQYGKLTNFIPVKNIFFGEIDGFEVIDCHNPQAKHYIVMLNGAIEIEVGNGAKRIFKEGDVLLAEDTTGQGHITRAVSQGLRKYLMIPLE